MTENSLEGLTDSLCNDIAKFHIAATEVMAINMESGMTINTMLGRDINTNIDSITGSTIINAYSHITSMDNELENGVLHEIDHVIRRSNLLVAGEMEKHPDLFTLFSQALKLTGLADSLTKKERKLTPPANSYNFYTPEKAILGYTIFAETDDVLAENNINSIIEQRVKRIAALTVIGKFASSLFLCRLVFNFLLDFLAVIAFALLFNVFTKLLYLIIADVTALNTQRLICSYR